MLTFNQLEIKCSDNYTLIHAGLQSKKGDNCWGQLCYTHFMNKDKLFVLLSWLVVLGLIIGTLIFFGTRHRAAQVDTPKPVTEKPHKSPCEMPLSQEDYAKCFPDKTDKGA